MGMSERTETDSFGEIQNGFSGKERLFVSILDLDIDDMYNLVVLATSIQEICA
jgi:hypothetical protein